MPDDVKRTAVVSDDGLYRYHLTREWGDFELMTFIMLNPSTADADIDDPTIRRCMSFARREGLAGIQVINLFALRTTKPGHLLDHPDPEGPENPRYWRIALQSSGPVVAAWGAQRPKLEDGGVFSWAHVRAIDDLEEECWYCLGHTSGNGEPRHPLYLKRETALVPL